MNSRQQQLRKAVAHYFDEWKTKFQAPASLWERSSLIMVGSMGAGIGDDCSDWDLHVIFDDESYRRFDEFSGQRVVIDDKDHRPPVFGVFHSLQWLKDRMTSRVALYLWIYENGIIVNDPDGAVCSIVSNGRKCFEDHLLDLLRSKYVAFRAERNGVPSCVRRSDSLAEGIIRARVVRLALQTSSLALGKPYPYEKWLPFHVTSISQDGATTVELCTKVLAESGSGCFDADKMLRDHISLLVRRRMGDAQWVSEWWKYLEN